MAKDYDISYGGSRKARDIYMTQIADIERQLARDGMYTGKVLDSETGEMEKRTMNEREARRLLRKLKYELDELEGYAFSERSQKNLFMEAIAAVIRGLKYIFNPSYRAECKALAERRELLAARGVFDEYESESIQKPEKDKSIDKKEMAPAQDKDAPEQKEPKDGQEQPASEDRTPDDYPDPFAGDGGKPKQETGDTKDDRKAKRDEQDKAKYDEIMGGEGTHQELMVKAVTENPYLVRFIEPENMTKEIALATVEKFRESGSSESPVHAITRAAKKNISVLKFYDDIHPGKPMQKAGAAASIIEKLPQAAEYIGLNDKMIDFIRKDMKDPRRFSKLEAVLSDKNLTPGLEKLAHELGFDKEIPAPEIAAEAPEQPADTSPLPMEPLPELPLDNINSLTPETPSEPELAHEEAEIPVPYEGLPEESPETPSEPESVPEEPTLPINATEEKYPWTQGSKALSDAAENAEEDVRNYADLDSMDAKERSRTVKNYAVTNNPELIYDLPSGEATEDVAAFAIVNADIHEMKINIRVIESNLNMDTVASKAINLLEGSGQYTDTEGHTDYDAIKDHITSGVMEGREFISKIDSLCNERSSMEAQWLETGPGKIETHEKGPGVRDNKDGMEI